MFPTVCGSININELSEQNNFNLRIILWKNITVSLKINYG